MTSNPLSASLPPSPPAIPSSPPRLLARPRTRFGIPVFRPASKTTPSYRKIELWWKPRPSWNRVTLRHACHVIAVRVSPCTSISISREITTTIVKWCAAVEKKKLRKGENLFLSLLFFFFFSFLSSIKGRIRVICESTTEELVTHTGRGYATRRVNDELLHLTTV